MEIQKTSLAGRRINDLPRLSAGAGEALRRSGRSNLFESSMRRRKLDIESDMELAALYPDILNFYATPPSYSISLQDFERYAVERLKLLRLIERINLTSLTRYSTEYFYELSQKIKEDELPTYYTMINAKFSKNEDRNTEESLEARKIDHISHFLLRLAYARTEEQRKWFISLEVDLFRLKLWKLYNLTPVLEKYNLPFTEATQEAKEYHPQIIASSTTPSSQMSTGDLVVYKVHFSHALDLVRNRRVFIKDGDAYVLVCDLAGVIALKFRSYLSESLSILKKNIHLVDDDERLRPLVSGFEKRHVGNDSSIGKSAETVTVAQLSGFSEKSFPLCMKHLYDVVQKEHHLKHWGRLQLGLFFKALGLPMDEATKFWRNNFTKRPEIDASRFDKQYLYNIRHMYGQEGKRADYTPYSCMKVINSNVGPGDHHGCPFKHSDATPLRTKLIDAGIPQEGIKEIMHLVEEKHFQIACQKYFEWTHDKFTIDGGVNHPNHYFLESRNILTGKKTIKSEVKVESTRTLYYKTGQGSTQSGQLPEAMDTLEETVDPMDEESSNALLSEMELQECNYY